MIFYRERRTAKYRLDSEFPLRRFLKYPRRYQRDEKVKSRNEEEESGDYATRTNSLTIHVTFSMSKLIRANTIGRRRELVQRDDRKLATVVIRTYPCS